MAATVKSAVASVFGGGTCDPPVDKLSRRQRGAPLEDVLFPQSEGVETLEELPFLTNISQHEDTTLRAGTVNPASPPRRAEAPCNTEGAKKGIRSSPLQGDSSREEVVSAFFGGCRSVEGQETGGKKSPKSGSFPQGRSVGDPGSSGGIRTADRGSHPQLRVEVVDLDLEEDDMEDIYNTDSDMWSVASSGLESRSGKRPLSSGSDTEAEHQFRRPGPVAKRGGKSAAQSEMAKRLEIRAKYQAKAMQRKDEEAIRRGLPPPSKMSLEERAEEVLDVDNMAAIDLLGAATCRLDHIADLIGKSANLKGGYSSKIRKAAGSVKQIVESMVSRTESGENRRLKSENGRLKRELASLKEEVGAYRKEVEELRTAMKESRKSEAPMSADQLSVLEKNISQLVGNLVEKRLAGIEARLPPARVIPPPPAGDNSSTAGKPGVKTATPDLTKSAGGSGTSGAMPKKARKGRAVRVPVSTAGPSTRKDKPAQQHPAPVTETWVEVVSRKKRKAATTKTPSVAHRKPVAQPRVKSKMAAPVSHRAPKKKKGPKIKAPASTAVILKLRPEAEERGATYTSALLKAEEKIDLQEMGIGPLRIRKSATGARLLEVPGASSHQKADDLAERLKSVLEDEMEISRPTRNVTFRVMGLDDAATMERLKMAVAKCGECAPEQVWVAEQRQDRQAPNSALIRCPIAAGKKIKEKGWIAVGWSKARVQLLETRPRHCFKCFGKGHAAAMCPSKEDRSRLCFRCGKPGHKAYECSAAPHCVVCAATGQKSTSHVMGGSKCNPPRTRGFQLSRFQGESAALSAEMSQDVSVEAEGRDMEVLHDVPPQ